MVFVTLGSQKFPFDRLLRAVDELIASGELTDEVFAQTGYSTYEPQHYAYSAFLDREEFAAHEAAADIVITHGGTGAIIGAVKQGKKVIAVPRLAQYGEHVDDHQRQLIDQFREQNLICGLDDCSQLGEALRTVRETTYDTYVSNTDTILNDIRTYLGTL